MAHFIAAKIEYGKPRVSDYVSYLLQSSPSYKDQSLSNVTSATVKEQLEKDAFELELNILAVLQYDFEFDMPFNYVNAFFARHIKSACPALPEQLVKDMHKNCLGIIRDSY